MEKNNCLLKGVILKQELSFWDLKLEPTPEGAAVSAPSSMEQKRFQRQVSILKGRLALLQAGQDPERPIAPGDLPKEEGPGDLLAVWYQRAREAAPLGKKLMSYVDLVRQEDDELDGRILELPAWSQEELETVDRGILAAAEGGFSV